MSEPFNTIPTPFKFTALAADPPGAEGMVYLNSVSHKLRAYLDGAWGDLGSGGGGAAAISYAQQFIFHDTVAFSAELFVGPVTPQSFGYSYTTGGAGFLAWLPFASSLKKVWFRVAAAMAANATIRLRTSADVVLWSGVLVAGQTQIVEDIDISLAAGVKVQFSVEPASGTLTLDHQECGFIRSIP